MKNKIKKFFCKKCAGDGWVEKWDGDNEKTGFENLVLEDCNVCKGKGHVLLEVIDKREVTKNKKADHSEKY